jgi:hypothetical protein
MPFTPIPYGAYGYYWNGRPGYYSPSPGSFTVGAQSSTASPTTMVVKCYIADTEAVLYGPEKTQDPVLASTTTMTGTPPPYPGGYWNATITDTWSSAGNYLAYTVIEADGVPVLSDGGVQWTGDEYVVIDTPLSTGWGTLAPTSMTCLLSVNFEMHLEDPDQATFDYPDRLGASADCWINWGDGNVQACSPYGLYGSDDAVSAYHAYATEGTYTITVWAGWYGGPGFYPPTIAGLVLPTEIGSVNFQATMPPQPFFAQPRATYTLDIADYSERNPVVVNNDYPLEDETFGYDYMLLTCPFSVMRTSHVTPDVSKVLPSAVTFHQPYTRQYNGYRYSGGYASGIIGVDTSVIMRRDLGSLEYSRADGVTEYGPPDYTDVDSGWFEHGDGPQPTKWRRDTDETDELFGSYLFSGPYYLNSYLPQTREGIYSDFEYDGDGPNRQFLQKYNIDTGVKTGRWIMPLLPDDSDLGYGSSFRLPEAYAMYGDTEVLWVSQTGGLWRHNPVTNEIRLIGNPFALLFEDPNGRGRTGAPVYPYGVTQGSDGFRARILNVRNDGSVTIVFYSRPVDFVPDESDFYDYMFGGYQWHVFSIDRGGRALGPPRPISQPARHQDGAPWPFESDWEPLSSGSWAESETVLVADPIAPLVYLPVEGKTAGNRTYASAIYSINVVTGEWKRPIWLGHPYYAWNSDATTRAPLPPINWWEDRYDFRYLEPGVGAACTNLPPGMYALRSPPGYLHQPGVLVVRQAEDGSCWEVRNDPVVGGVLAYVQGDGTTVDTYPLGATLVSGDEVRILTNKALISVFVNHRKRLSIRDTRNMTATKHGIAAAANDVAMDEYSLRKTVVAGEYVIRDADVKFAPNA